MVGVEAGSRAQRVSSTPLPSVPGSVVVTMTVTGPVYQPFPDTAGAAGSRVVAVVGGVPSAGAMVTVKVADAVAKMPLEAWTVTVAAPAVVGLPEITPAGDSDRPGGSAPEVMVNSPAGVPRLEVKVWL